jgi:hypothetical protein
MDARQRETTRAAARATVRDHLGIGPDLEALLDSARACLGIDRLDRCVELVRGMRLSQRYHGLSAMAALVSGTKELGEGWWVRPHEDPVGRPERTSARETPDQRLASASPSEQRVWTPAMVELSWWIADDAAVAAWGPLVDDVDLNDPRGLDRIRLPASAEIGQRLMARFDPGGVIDVIVEARDDGALGSRLVDETRHSTPAEVDWAWAVALPPPGPFPLPGDSPQVYGSAVDRGEAERLREEALSFGWLPNEVGPRWETRQDLCSALARLGWPWLDGSAASQAWERAASNLLDAAEV